MCHAVSHELLHTFGSHKVTGAAVAKGAFEITLSLAPTIALVCTFSLSLTPKNALITALTPALTYNSCSLGVDRECLNLP